MLSEPTNLITMFTHLHVHSNYSFCRGASKIEDLVDAALARGMSAMALTDINGVYGLIWFLQYAAERGLRPIVGSELRTETERATLLARNRDGYETLCRIISRRRCEPDFCLSKALIEERENLIVLSDQIPLLSALGRQNGTSDIYVELNDPRAEPPLLRVFPCQRNSAGGNQRRLFRRSVRFPDAPAAARHRSEHVFVADPAGGTGERGSLAETGGGNGAPVSSSRKSSGEHAAHCGGVLARPGYRQARVPVVRSSRRIGCFRVPEGRVLPRRRAPLWRAFGFRAEAPGTRTEDHQGQRLRDLFPDCAGYCPAVGAHLRPRIGGREPGFVLPRDHACGADHPQSLFRALSQRRPHGSARYRHRFPLG